MYCNSYTNTSFIILKFVVTAVGLKKVWSSIPFPNQEMAIQITFFFNLRNLAYVFVGV